MYNQKFPALLCLHADKAKGLQINLSEALQGNTNAEISYSFCQKMSKRC